MGVRERIRGSGDGDAGVGERGYVDMRGRMRGCAREDAWVGERGYVGVVAGMRKLWRIRRRSR